jgi:glycosyltransferase involved in cell wall biosynthesis
MNIIYTGAFRFPNIDAASQRVLSNAKIARDLGHNVIFCGWEKFIDQNSNTYKGFNYYSQSELDIQTNNPFKKIFNFLFRGKKTLRWINEYVKSTKIDIIIIYNSGFYFTKKLIEFGKTHNINVIVDCTEWYEGSHLPGGKYGIVNLENTIRMYYLLPRVKNLIVISSFLEKFYRKKKCNIIRIPPLVDLKDEKWTRTNALQQKINDKIVIIYAGDPGKKDILKLVLDALEVINSEEIKIIFKIIGINENDLINNLVLSYVPSFVNCIGRIKMDEVPFHYHNSSYSILIRENKRYANAGFSTKLVESLCCGLPIITNSTSDIKNYISNENGYILKELTINELIEVFTSIINESKFDYIKKSHIAFETSKNNFHYEKYKYEFDDFLNSLIN